jgi:hypothetical protein
LAGADSDDARIQIKWDHQKGGGVSVLLAVPLKTVLPHKLADMRALIENKLILIGTDYTFRCT